MTPPGTECVRAALEAAAGRRVAALERLRRGAQSVNYAGRWADGSRFALKLVPFARAEQYARLVEHLERAGEGPVVRECAPRVRFDLADFHAVLTDWCEGAPRPFRFLADAKAFLASYRVFSESVRSLERLYPAYDYRAMLARVASSPLACVLPKGLSAEAFAPLERDRVVIHGDFQSDNLRFDGETLARVLDIEEFRPGRPVEDFARYALCDAGRFGPFAWRARARTVSALVAVARAAPYGADEWSAAIWGQLLEFLCKNLGKGHVSSGARWRLRWRARFYERLERTVRRAVEGRGT